MKTAKKSRQAILLISLTALILITIIIGMGLGPASLSYNRLLPTLFGNGTFPESFVLFDIRLPRITVTLLAGMALALSGTILQGITRNDLTDPGIIGINSGAGLGIAVFFLFMPIDAGSFAYVLPLVGFVSALLTAMLIYLFSYSKQHGLQPVRLVLVGVGFSMALSGMMIVLISSADREKVDFIAKWLAGNIWGTDWPFVLALLPWILIILPLTLYMANRLNVLALSEEVGVGIGVQLNRDRIILMVAAVAIAAAAVSVAGGISFVGLMAPHIARALVGARHQYVLPVASLIGGWLLLLADTIGRNITTVDGLPAGIVVAFIGAPYFLYLLLKK
ncbi:FecCD family ABC transporter permease [Terribacillus saccharophilus]|uniref:Iron ABC transporter permease n=1 Tax=Terribacillus saccharophilus TaxID=361277 RepID=A0A268A6W2_9BACI|nr:iron ABC transporter permease [Terribacillus saccharophilus]PAD19851.1 iron ABC transporter permease [Terribacillus saccharophilus]PAF19182.1 iron ABC transporter permease [Terribacillus saccharophilus]PAF22998.1 iron ABC transporter permease [Terribacillus saccharophilus]PAF36685.1 iron ABC transporter permease [Terribacillus saccharophilus]